MSKRCFSIKKLDKLRELYDTGEYTKSELAILFKCSITTISLWIPKKSIYRENKIHNMYKKKIEECKKCGGDLHSHLRCRFCTILLHNEQCSCEKKYENNQIR